MRNLPLFKAGVLAPIEAVTPRECSPSCELCTKIKPVGAVSHSPQGEPGGILLVGDMPTQVEARAGMLPFSTQAGTWLVQTIARATSLPIAVDYAVRCALGGAKVAEATIAQCRPHLANTLSEVQPQVIFVFGPHACNAVLGRAFNAAITTDGIGFTSEGTPVIVFPKAADIVGNRFRRKAFEASLAWALGPHEAPPWHVPFQTIETAEDAELACAELAAAEWFAFDTETDGLTFTDYFRINTLAACSKGSRTAWLWDEHALLDPERVAPLIRLMCNPNARKVAHNLKFDNHAVNFFFSIQMTGQHICTLLWARLIDSECDGRLEVLAEKVGMGGHKAEAKKALLQACAVIREVQDGLRAPANAREEQALQYSELSEKTWAYGVLNKEIRDRYCARDCVTTVMLCEQQDARIAPEQRRHWDVLVSKTTDAIQQVEAWGLPVDQAHLAKYETWLGGEMAVAESELNELAGRTVNPGNNGDVHKLLFDELKMKSVKNTPGGKPSVDKDALKFLAQHAKGKTALVIEKLLLWRKLAKQKSTYATGMLPHVRGDGRVHTSLNIAGASSGRLSSSQPNCFTGDTEVLTPDGWVAFTDLKAGTPVMQWDDGRLMFAQPTAYIQTTATTMIDIQGLHTHLRVTPDHRCALRLRYAGKLHVFSAADYPTEEQDWHQLHGGIYAGGTVKYHRPKLTFLAACMNGGKLGADGQLQISSRKPWNIRWAASALDVLGQSYMLSPENARSVGGTITVSAGRMVSWALAILDERMAPGPWMFLLDAESRRHCLHEMMRWSGAGNTFRSSDKTSVDFVQALCALADIKTRMQFVDQRGTQAYWQVEAFAHNYSAANTLTKRESTGTFDVYCLSVPSSYLLVRYGGCVHVTAQCQNIPRARGNEEGRMARNVFCASSPDHTLLELDFRQLEICVAAGLSGDRKMQAILAEGVDFHLRTAEMISMLVWGISPAQVAKIHRDAAKTINFAVLYGQGIPRLAHAMGVSHAMAERTQSAIFDEFKDLIRWIRARVAWAKTHGETWTEWGGLPARRRPLIAIAGADLQAAGSAERSSYNTSVQGGASDFCLSSVVDCVDWLRGDCVPAELVLTVHDSLLFNVRNDVLAEVSERAEAIMTSRNCNGVQLRVDKSKGQSWGQLVEA